MFIETSPAQLLFVIERDYHLNLAEAYTMLCDIILRDKHIAEAMRLHQLSKYNCFLGQIEIDLIINERTLN